VVDTIDGERPPVPPSGRHLPPTGCFGPPRFPSTPLAHDGLKLVDGDAGSPARNSFQDLVVDPPRSPDTYKINRAAGNGPLLARKPGDLEGNVL
jgi:hypothetical protein